MRYVLASKSPRRRQLLGELLDSFDILTADTDESLPSGMHPREGVRVLAERKGAAVLPLLGDEVYGAGKIRFEKLHASLFDGQALHAKRLSFIHPRTEEKMEFESNVLNQNPF